MSYMCSKKKKFKPILDKSLESNQMQEHNYIKAAIAAHFHFFLYI